MLRKIIRLGRTVNERKIRVVNKQDRLPEQHERPPEDHFGDLRPGHVHGFDFGLGLQVVIVRGGSETGLAAVEDLGASARAKRYVWGEARRNMKLEERCLGSGR